MLSFLCFDRIILLTVSALKALLRGSRYVGTKSGIRNYVKPGGYSTALKEFESIHYPLVVKDVSSSLADKIGVRGWV